MDPKQFDKLAASVGRRTILGGALAGILGLGTATLADAAKGKVAGKKKTKQRVGKEVICTGPGANPLAGQCPVGTCCSPTGPTQPVVCLTPAQQTTALCGNGNTGGPCAACPTGTRCVAGVCVCDATTCPTGCCTPPAPGTGTQACIPNGSGTPTLGVGGIPAGSFVCGTGGGICNVCSSGLVPPFGGAQTFTGCCTAQGACSAGTAGTNCGTNGLICQVCTANQTCGLNQQCSNNFAPPVPPVPPAPAPAPVCGNTQRLCGGICVDILNNNLNCGACNFVCGGRKRCSGGTCKRTRRRRRGGKN